MVCETYIFQAFVRLYLGLITKKNVDVLMLKVCNLTRVTVKGDF